MRSLSLLVLLNNAFVVCDSLVNVKWCKVLSLF